MLSDDAPEITNDARGLLPKKKTKPVLGPKKKPTTATYRITYRAAFSHLRHAAVYSYHVNATFLRLIPHSTTIATLHMNRRQAVRWWVPGAQPQTARPSLVMGDREIIGTVNLTFLIQFPLAKNFQR